MYRSSPCFSTNFNVSRNFLRPLLMGSGAFNPRFNQFMLNLKAINLSKKQGLIGEYLISGLELENEISVRWCHLYTHMIRGRGF